MYLATDPQLLAVKHSIEGVVRERDFLLALFFFSMEAVLLAWLLPMFLDKRAELREERRRLPTQRIAAERVADSLSDLFQNTSSLCGALSAADSIAATEDLVEQIEERLDTFGEHLEITTERLGKLSGTKPEHLDWSSETSNQPSSGRPRARQQRQLNLDQNLFIERSVDMLLQSVEDTQRTIDAFLPVFSIEMIECAARIYERLAQTEKPYRSLKRAFLNPNDAPSVMGATDAWVDAHDFIFMLKQLCDLIEVDLSKYVYALELFPNEEQQKRLLEKFLYFYFEGSYKQLKIDSGLD